MSNTPNTKLELDFREHVLVRPKRARYVGFDGDDPAAGQQTVIATSPVRWNRCWSFGALVWLASKAGRFPSFGSRM